MRTAMQSISMLVKHLRMTFAKEPVPHVDGCCVVLGVFLFLRGERTYYIYVGGFKGFTSNFRAQCVY